MLTESDDYLISQAGLAHAFCYELDKKKPTPERFVKAVETIEQAYKCDY